MTGVSGVTHGVMASAVRRLPQIPAGSMVSGKIYWFGVKRTYLHTHFLPTHWQNIHFDD